MQSRSRQSIHRGYCLQIRSAFPETTNIRNSDERGKARSQCVLCRGQTVGHAYEKDEEAAESHRDATPSLCESAAFSVGTVLGVAA